MERMKETIKNCGAADVGFLAFDDCEIINQRLKNSINFQPRTVVLGIVPYYTPFCDESRKVSAYALAHDYHLLLRQICERAVSELKAVYPEYNFMPFGDHSPINEKLAAAKAGLGIIGDHSLLITERYSSFVFIFEIITDMELDVPAGEIKNCDHCGACKAVCPADFTDKKSCVSAITQKKGDLTESEAELIKKTDCAWGCDLCQLVCPHTLKARKEKTIYSDSIWFNSNIVKEPNAQTVADTDDFCLRAYSWRGESTILRNIALLDEKSNSKDGEDIQ